MTAVQSQIMSIRDSIQAGRSRSGMTGRPIGFAAEPSSDRLESNPLYDNELAALLGYARTDSKSPLYKAAPAPAAAPAVAPGPTWAVWGLGFGDWERRTGSSNGIDIGRRTLTGGGLVGLDVTFSNFTSPAGALVLGVLGAGMRSTTHNAIGSEARVDGPGAGVYAIYINGGFSTDLTWKEDLLTVAPSTLPTSVGLNNSITAWNIQQKFAWGPSWIEPTGGVSYNNAIWNAGGHAAGFNDGYAWRVQAGLRAGTSWDAGGGVTLQPVLTALAYDDVKVSGGTLAVVLAGIPQAPTDQGKVFGLFNAKLNADYGYGLSAYVEGEVRGATGVVGTAVRGGIRKSFQ
jgi:outer membrane autotransporter protein